MVNTDIKYQGTYYKKVIYNNNSEYWFREPSVFTVVSEYTPNSWIEVIDDDLIEILNNLYQKSLREKKLNRILNEY